MNLKIALAINVRALTEHDMVGVRDLSVSIRSMTNSSILAAICAVLALMTPIG